MSRAKAETSGLRPVVASDVPEVIALVRDVLAEYGLEFGAGSGTDEQLRGLPESYAGGGFFVAHDEGALVGTAGLYPVSDGTLELRKMYVRGSARGRGVAGRLWRACLELARGAKARRIVLDTTNQMTEAIALYERIGFIRDDAQIRGARCHRGYRLDL